MERVVLTARSLRDLEAHAREAYPEECCGFVLRRQGCEEVVRVRNIQDEKHREDSTRFPRRAATAYFMGPEAVPILVAHDRGELVIEAIYHSHPDHDAYFSSEDRARATLWGRAVYPDSAQIVVAVRNGKVEEVKAYRWDKRSREFLAVPLSVR